MCIRDSYDTVNKTVKFSIDEIGVNAKKNFKIRVKAKNFEENKNIYNLQVSAIVYTNEENKYRSAIDEKEIKTTYFSIVQTCSKEGQKLKKDEEIEYVFEVKNEGEVKEYINFIDDLPDGILPISVEYQMYEAKGKND